MSLREKKMAMKKEQILRSAVNILSEKGYHGTTMEEIAAQLYMTKGSIYYYFKDKEDLLFQSQIMLYQKSIENMESIASLAIPADEKLQRAMVVHTEYIIQERSVFSMGIKPEQIFTNTYLQEILQARSVYANCFDRLIAEGIETGIFEADDLKIVRNILLGAMNWVVQWYSPSGNLNETELAETISKYLLRILQKQ